MRKRLKNVHKQFKEEGNNYLTPGFFIDDRGDAIGGVDNGVAVGVDIRDIDCETEQIISYSV